MPALTGQEYRYYRYQNKKYSIVTTINKKDSQMKKLSFAFVAVITLAIACGGSGTPEQAVRSYFDALQSADGDAVVNCMSVSSIENVNENIELSKDNPGFFEYMTTYAAPGVDITAEEIVNMTIREYYTAILSSEGTASQMGELSDVEIGSAIIEGEKAYIYCTLDGRSLQPPLYLVLEDGNWMIDCGIEGVREMI